MAVEAGDAEQRDRELWRRAAQAWERHQEALRERTGVVSAWLVDAIDPKPGEHVLDLAAGAGETGFIAAQRLGSEGRLLSSDQASEMVEVAKRRAAELGLDNVDFAVLDAQRLELDPGSFDAAVCRWGYMLMADPDAALSNTRRVLRDGGRLALATWYRPDRNLWMSAPVIALVGHGVIPPPNPADPTPFTLHDPADLERRLRAAGFSSARTELLEFEMRYPSDDEYWAETLDMAAPIAGAIKGLGQEATDAVRNAVRNMLSPFTAADGRIAVPACAVVAAAVA